LILQAFQNLWRTRVIYEPTGGRGKGLCGNFSRRNPAVTEMPETSTLVKLGSLP
jgi:hypothetical protein